MSLAAGRWRIWAITVSGRCSQLFELDAPFAVESRPSHVCTLRDNVAVKVRNDYSFPAACTIRFRFAAKGARPALDLFWYDGSMRPPTPEEMEAENKELAAEGMMFVGDKGKILAGFLGEDAQIIPERKMREFQARKAAGRGAAARAGKASARLGRFGWRPARAARPPTGISCWPGRSRTPSTWGRFRCGWEASDSLSTPQARRSPTWPKPTSA